MIKIVKITDTSDPENPQTLYKKYSTTAAGVEQLATFSFGVGTDQELNEGLYKTLNGEWFLGGSGGAESKYAGGEGITILSEESALQWLVDHAPDSEAINTYFADKIVEA